MGVNSKSRHIDIQVNAMFIVCIGLVFGSKMQFHIICSLQYNRSINTTEVDPHQDLLHNSVVKRKNCKSVFQCFIAINRQKQHVISGNFNSQQIHQGIFLRASSKFNFSACESRQKLRCKKFLPVYSCLSK